MDIRFLWLSMVAILWTPALFTPYNDLAIVLSWAMTIILSVLIGCWWAEYKLEEHQKKNTKKKGDDK